MSLSGEGGIDVEELTLTKDTPWRKHRGACIRILILLCLILLYGMLLPWYRQYVAAYEWQSCADARILTAGNVTNRLREAGHSGDLLSVIEESFRETVPGCKTHREKDRLLVYDLCRAGGVVSVTVTDAGTGAFTIQCDAKGHDLVVTNETKQ